MTDFAKISNKIKQVISLKNALSEHQDRLSFLEFENVNIKSQSIEAILVYEKSQYQVQRTERRNSLLQTEIEQNKIENKTFSQILQNNLVHRVNAFLNVHQNLKENLRQKFPSQDWKKILIDLIKQSYL